jgi:hypothetical protein
MITSIRRTLPRLGRASTGLTVLAMAVAAVFSAPAQATVTQLGATPDTNYGLGTNYGTGCDYTLQAFVDDPVAPVSFYDNGVPIGAVRPGGASALIPWVPVTQGVHHLTALQAGQPARLPAAFIDLRVGVGVHIGYGCVVVGG